MEPSLSIVTAALGLAGLLPAAVALAKPDAASSALKKFPRAVSLGCVFVVVATAWFVFNLKNESIADFEPMKPYLMAALAALGIGTCLFVQDFIAVRGLAVLLLLVANLMLNAGRPHLGESPLVTVNQSLAYLLIVIGLWLTIAPWRLRDWFGWITANAARLKLVSGLVGGFGLFLLIVGLTVFRQLK